MLSVRAFLLGAAATGVVAYVFAAALALVAAAGGSTIRLGVGRIVLVSVASGAHSSTTVLGSGLLVVALAGGVLNLVTARVLRRRRDRQAIT